MAHSDPFITLDATAQAELVRRKEVKPSELVEAAMRRLDRLNPRLNAVVLRLDEQARREAAGPLPQGPFTGVPFLLKDFLAGVAGVPTAGGSAFLREAVTPHDTELVARYRRAGLVILGKTNLPELGILPTTEPRAFGATRNPWNPEHSVGGSSGGSAAAVAAGIVPFAHGNDGGGSIRIPASCCGLFGLKPSRGRNPLGPELGEVMHGFVVEHALTRSVRDSAALLDATEGLDVGAPYAAPPKARPFLQEVGAPPGRLRVRFTTRSINGVPVHEDCVNAVREAAALLESLGPHVEEGSLETPMQDLAQQSFIAVYSGAVVTGIDGMALLQGLEVRPELFEPLTWAMYELGKGMPLSDYLLALGTLQMFARQVARHFVDTDVWLTPVLAEPPPPLGSFEAPPDSAMEALLRAAAYAPFTPVANFTGQPAMSVPLGTSSAGLPIGVHVMGRYGDEATLFRLASQLEEARPWAQRLPTLAG
ncbi:MAG: amidase [Myxococcaceae bacterium]|nr:amidase [Myxococcaceae bacterium]